MREETPEQAQERGVEEATASFEELRKKMGWENNF